MITTRNKFTRAKNIFMKSATKFAEAHEEFDAQEAWGHLLDNDDFINELVRCKTTIEIDVLTESYLEHYIW
jgi:hypothetical protein